MRIKLFLLLLLTAVMPSLAQKAGVTGTVVDSKTGAPIEGATVLIDQQGLQVTTDAKGMFKLPDIVPGQSQITVIAYGYGDLAKDVIIPNGTQANIGVLTMSVENSNSAFRDEQVDMLYDQSALDDEEGAAQSIAALTGASDDIFYNTASYDFQPMFFRVRGYDSKYSQTYINGICFNDLARGRFNYSTLGGMNRSFRDKTMALGLGASDFAFGNIGGASDINTTASHYAPGFNGSIALTNSAYMLRGNANYSTGISKDGWALSLSAIGRYAGEGVVPGTFYNSFGLFASLEKIFNANHSVNLTVWAAPTQRATSSPSYIEAYELAGSNLYNPNWGWQDGKKRSAKIVETFDPTAMLNWFYKSNDGNTKVNTGLAFRNVNYSTSSLGWYNAADPRPDYYRNLPSFYKTDEVAFATYTDLWMHDENFRQINWDKLYQANYLNNIYGRGGNPDNHASSYILENRRSNQLNEIFTTTLNTRLNSFMTLQAGADVNMTQARYYKTIRDLLGGEYWIDTDQYSERDFPDNPNAMQNNLLDPNRKVYEGDVFGYDYNINAVQASVWIQNQITLPRWDINYAAKLGYTQFYRDGKMKNGRAPENSLGKGKTHRFDTGALKAGATYKIDGRNFVSAHAAYETQAPLFEYAYISPRIKDTAIADLTPERILSGDLSYTWNYRRFRGTVTGFWTDMFDQIERTAYYDDQYQTFMNYVLKGVHTSYKGVELGAAFKVTPSVTLSAAGTFARYQYKNRPQGTRSYENGMRPDTTQTVYLKNFFVGGTPQQAYNVGINWQAPNSWFFEINASYMADAYVNVSPIRHEALPNLWEKYPQMSVLEAKMDELAKQDKLNNAFVLNASVGKFINITRQVSMNLNLNVNNLLNNKNIQTFGFQQGRFDYTNYDATKFPNKYSYAQGIHINFNAGIRF